MVFPCREQIHSGIGDGTTVSVQPRNAREGRWTGTGNFRFAGDTLGIRFFSQPSFLPSVRAGSMRSG